MNLVSLFKNGPGAPPPPPPPPPPHWPTGGGEGVQVKMTTKLADLGGKLGLSVNVYIVHDHFTSKGSFNIKSLDLLVKGGRTGIFLFFCGIFVCTYSLLPSCNASS